MPIKNAAPYLAACLDSIIAQTESDWELLAVNDHSTDDTAEILARYAALDSRIKPLFNAGQGIIPALQTAFISCCGDLITRMDADDLMSDIKLASLKQLLLDSGAGHLATGKVRYFSDTVLGDGYKRYERWLNSLVDGDNHYEEIYRECVIPSPCWMLWRKDLCRCGAFDSDRYPEDYDLYFRFYLHNLKIVSSSLVLHHWRDYAVRTSRTHEHYRDNRFLSLKLDYYIRLELPKVGFLGLYGAGKKGKWLAKVLVAQGIPFRWFCNNEQKIGKSIYGILMESDQALFESSVSQLIFAVAMPDVQLRLKEALSGKGMRIHFFC